jgi:glycosyltransferase involved in cell wall biosynthesis
MPDETLSDALLISESRHPFLKFILSNLKNTKLMSGGKKAFINKVYDLYENKDTVEILSFRKVNPCTRDEIRLYTAGLIAEEDMEDKLSDALCICYYKKQSRNTIYPNRATDVLYLSTTVGYGGGASIAAHRIHLGLRNIGINSKMLVLGSTLHEKGNLADNIHIAIPERNEITGYLNDLAPLRNYPLFAINSNTFAPAVAGTNINRYIELFNPDIVQIHGINAGFVTIEELGRIKKKIVWRLPDCWTFTGGCYYFGDCKRYMTGCGKCPKLGSDNENDLSHEVWLRKECAWKNMDMTIVVPTPWMKDAVENSALLKGRNVYVIPNGLNLDEFYPIKKETARQALKFPQDKKIILFGATNAIDDPRKGFSLLYEALRILAEKHKDEYYLAVFGSTPRELNLDIPVRFMGHVREHLILQLCYSAADVMIVPSLEEAFGQTVIEAMACATPVVSFLNTGPAGIIEHKQTGYLARYADSTDLANGIEWILGDDNLIGILSSNARRRIETTYDIKIIAGQYKHLYHTI